MRACRNRFAQAAEMLPLIVFFMGLLAVMISMMTNAGHTSKSITSVELGAAFAKVTEREHGAELKRAEDHHKITEQRQRQLDDSCSAAQLPLLRLSICSSDYMDVPLDYVSAKPHSSPA